MATRDSKGKPKKKGPDPEKQARVNPELDGFKVGVDPFGEVNSNFDIDRINQFLDKSVDDKKLRSKPERVKKQKKDPKSDNPSNS